MAPPASTRGNRMLSGTKRKEREGAASSGASSSSSSSSSSSASSSSSRAASSSSVSTADLLLNRASAADRQRRSGHAVRSAARASARNRGVAAARARAGDALLLGGGGGRRSKSTSSRLRAAAPSMVKARAARRAAAEELLAVDLGLGRPPTKKSRGTGASVPASTARSTSTTKKAPVGPPVGRLRVRLPRTFAALLQSFSALDNTLALMRSRKTHCTFRSIQSAVQKVSRHNFTVDMLWTMVAVDAEAFDVKRYVHQDLGDGGGASARVSGLKKDHDIIIAPKVEGAVSKGRSVNPASALRARRAAFEAALMRIVWQRHDAFVASLSVAASSSSGGAGARAPAGEGTGAGELRKKSTRQDRGKIAAAVAAATTVTVQDLKRREAGGFHPGFRVDDVPLPPYVPPGKDSESKAKATSSSRGTGLDETPSMGGAASSSTSGPTASATRTNKKATARAGAAATAAGGRQQATAAGAAVAANEEGAAVEEVEDLSIEAPAFKAYLATRSKALRKSMKPSFFHKLWLKSKRRAVETKTHAEHLRRAVDDALPRIFDAVLAYFRARRKRSEVAAVVVKKLVTSHVDGGGAVVSEQTMEQRLRLLLGRIPGFCHLDTTLDGTRILVLDETSEARVKAMRRTLRSGGSTSSSGGIGKGKIKLMR